MTDCPSARRLAATHGDGLPHLWRWPCVGLWACALRDVTVDPDASKAWSMLTGRTPRPVPVRQRRRAALHLTRIGGSWGCECDIGGIVVRVAGSDPRAAIRSCRAIQRADA